MKKSEKARKKDFSRRAAHLFFEISALCPADLTADRVHKYHVKKITYERLFIYPTSGVKIGVLTPKKSACSKNRLFEYTIKQRSGTFRRCKCLFFIKWGIFYTFPDILPVSGRVVTSSHSTPYFPPLSPNFRSPSSPFPHL